MDREVELGYIEVVDKLERRLGYRELPETARVTFSGARQGEEESVDDWADRVLTLAGKAFRQGFKMKLKSPKIINLFDDTK